MNINEIKKETQNKLGISNVEYITEDLLSKKPESIPQELLKKGIVWGHNSYLINDHYIFQTGNGSESQACSHKNTYKASFDDWYTETTFDYCGHGDGNHSLKIKLIRKNKLDSDNYQKEIELLENSPKPLSRYAVDIVAFDDDKLKVKLCSGNIITIPSSCLRQNDLIGLTEIGEKRIPKNSISFKTDTPEHRTIASMAATISDLVHLSYFNRNIESNNLINAETISVSCSGSACDTSFSYFRGKKRILNHAFKSSNGCTKLDIVVLGKDIRVHHTALPGSFCGTSYTGSVSIDVVFEEE